MASKSRIYILLWFSFELFLGLLALTDNELNDLIPNYCRMKRAASTDCPRGWLTTAEPKTCVRKYDSQETFPAAQKICKDQGGRLYTPTSEKQLKWVIEKFESDRIWVGLEDDSVRKGWYWRNGEPFQVKYWDDGEGSGAWQKCGFLISSKFADDKCIRRRSYLCQKSSQRGPRDISIKIHWHGEGVFYEGLQATVSCSAFHPENNKFTWHPSLSKNMFTHGGPIITYEEAFDLNSGGGCGIRFTSNYTYTATKNLQNLKLTCYARAFSGETCPPTPEKDAFCIHTGALKVVENTGPTVNLNQPKPGPVQMNVETQMRPSIGLYTTITCTSVNPPGGVIKSVFLFGRYYNVGVGGLSARRSHVMMMNKLGRMANQTVLTLEFKPDKYTNGMEVICYHDGAYLGRMRYIERLCSAEYSSTGRCAKSKLVAKADEVDNIPLQPGNTTDENSPSPDLKPDLYMTIRYKGAPAPIRAGYPVQVECKLETSKEDEPVWIVRPSEASFKEDLKIFEYSTRTQYSNKEGTNRNIITLKYVFSMTEKLAGTTFACFSSDESKRRENGKCDKSKDMLCDTAEPLKLAENTVSQSNQFDETSVVMNLHREDGAHFLGGTIVATCKSREVVDGKFVWVLRKGETLVDVYTKEHDKGAPKVKGMKTSTLTFNATESHNGARLTCYSVHFMYYHGCSTHGSPDYCRNSRTIYVVDGPQDTPEVTIWYPGFPGAALVGTILTSNCIVNIGGDDSTFLWVIYMKDRTISFKGEGERIKYHSVETDENGTQYINSTIEFTINTIMDGMQIACFAYDPGRYRDTLECIESDNYCYISSEIQVMRVSPGHSSYGTLTLVLGSLLLGFGCAMAWTRHGGSSKHGEESGKGPKASLNKPDEQRSFKAINIRASNDSTTIY